MRSIACFGGLHLDVKALLGGPLRRGTSNPVTTSRSVGGVACNVARSLARLGVAVRIVSLVGEGAGPVLEAVAEEGVDVSAVVVVPGAITASYTALLAPDGSLEAGVADMAVYDRMDADWGFAAEPWGDIWFVDANVAATGLEALRVSSTGRPMYLDPVSVQKAGRIRSVIEGAAGVFPDAGEAEALTGSSDPVAAAAALRAGGAMTVAVTVGHAGVVWAAGSGVERRAAFPPRSVVDVTGAGDAFAAGHLAAVALGGEDPVGWGLAAASLAVETLDTVPHDLSLPRLLDRLQTAST